FLDCEYPSAPYPKEEDIGQRELETTYCPKITNSWPSKKLKGDVSPWIVSKKNWSGIRLKKIKDDFMDRKEAFVRISERFNHTISEAWSLRDDTFPSNLALFRPQNFSITRSNIAKLTLQKEYTSVREYTSGAICSRQLYGYGRFQAMIKPAKASGLITGIFLHRNSPRQEIDLEILGKDTTKVLLNVFYNPGPEGTKLEYGYRGTPVIIDLGFDAAIDFHCYTIEWSQIAIRWYVDGKLICERVSWDPTPIPHLPMQFNVNLWYSRSIELAGRLGHSDLPVYTELSLIDINAQMNKRSGGKLARIPNVPF
ncbi:MAG: family 16 glycosylhydrolase, partial [Candidatus Omnitrophica bacterium]|nr:family 16 glycosylhydrolase [Candidatus Omnitrophota bacterium]